jgi:hypothetical protein
MEKIVPISKITFTFPERFYEKYDIFEVEGIEYICINRPKKLDSGEWCINVYPVGEKSVYDTLESKWKRNTVAELYNENVG